MPFILLLIAAIFLVAAFNNTQGSLATALEQDVPGYLKWAAALAAVGALGWVPGMQKISRYLLALVLLVIFLRNYQNILAGFRGVAQSGATPLASNPTPAADYVSSGYTAAPVSSINPASSTGTVGIATSPATASAYMLAGNQLVPVEYTGNVNAANNTTYTTASLPFGQFDPALYSGSTASDSGFGGIA